MAVSFLALVACGQDRDTERWTVAISFPGARFDHPGLRHCEQQTRELTWSLLGETLTYNLEGKERASRFAECLQTTGLGSVSRPNQAYHGGASSS